MNKELLSVVKLASLMYLYSPSIAFAYVDPGSGSVIITTILGIFAAITYTFRKYFYKVMRKLRGKNGEDEKSRSLED